MGFGDSGFFHISIPAICNSAYQESNIVMVLLDNGSAKTSGGQTTPASGKNALEQTAPILHFDQITQACGVKKIFKTHIDTPDYGLTQTFQKSIEM